MADIDPDSDGPAGRREPFPVTVGGALRQATRDPTSGRDQTWRSITEDVVSLLMFNDHYLQHGVKRSTRREIE